jgi:hypothetical protein
LERGGAVATQATCGAQEASNLPPERQINLRDGKDHGQMKRIILAFAVGAITTIGLFPAGAAASGPAAPGKELVQLDCEGLGAVTVSVPGPAGSNGAGQVVGQKGHGIVVSSRSLVLDFSTFSVVKEESRESGNGNGHPNQPTVSCRGITFEGTASELFGSELPPGVGPDDAVIAGFEAQVIVKP